MNTAIRAMAVAVLMLAGCGESSKVDVAAGETKAPAEIVPGVGQTLAVPIPMAEGKAPLSADNSTILFTCNHTGKDPNPRTGTFSDFSGAVQLDPENDTLQSITIEIKADSLTTDIEKLTNHLKSPDFLDVREHPTISFQSTRIAAEEGKPNKYQVTGDLTLHGVTKEITFPAEIEVASDTLRLRSEFKVDRTEFGIDYGQEQVEKEVALKVTVGQRSAALKITMLPPADQDPELRFRYRDTNEDGKLVGDEISERMREHFDSIDKDGDDAVTLAEYRVYFAQGDRNWTSPPVRQMVSAPAN